VRFHERDVLVSGRVEDDVRPLVGEDRQQVLEIADRDQRLPELDVERLVAKLRSAE